MLRTNEPYKLNGTEIDWKSTSLKNACQKTELSPQAKCSRFCYRMKEQTQILIRLTPNRLRGQTFKILNVS